MASSSQPVTFQLEALSALHAEYACKEKKGLKRKLATSEKELNNAEAVQRLREAFISLEMEDIKIHCETSKALTNDIHTKLAKVYCDRMTLSEEDVWQMMRSINEMSNRLTNDQERQ